MGETVYLYRDAEFSTKQRVGIGTVVENETEKYEADGTVIRLCVGKGEEIERGQLLYETVSGSGTEIRADAAGIVSGVNAANGERVQKGQTLATVVPRESVCVEIAADETQVTQFRKGMRVEITYEADREETPAYGTVAEIADADGSYRVAIVPDETDGLRLGMTAWVRIEPPSDG